ncbi:type I-E CRISPR-associated protein Cse2/CasB [Microbispora sp. SCL1-1]|nr:type I-E CRISPR-associated protein Cse2/CasB [Microbispora sp. CL1-1]TQS03050.1 type I-E CRISPR-associated protein Cse2/CasB [Microbispora sp. SCL1-1]
MGAGRAEGGHRRRRPLGLRIAAQGAQPFRSRQAVRQVHRRAAPPHGSVRRQGHELRRRGGLFLIPQASSLEEIRQRRRRFVNHLYGLHAKLESGRQYQSAEARRDLALLRRSLAGGRQEADAYAVVFPYDPPIEEQQAWLLVAGLFALHPQPRPRTSPGPSGAQRPPSRSIGVSMRRLVERRSSAERRFLQLLGVDRTALPHYLRQAVQLLHTENIPLDYDRLLDDVVILMSEHHDPERAHRVRLTWARDFHRQLRQTPANAPVAPTA